MRDGECLLPTGAATLCISVAARPSRFGITVHNAGYRALGLDFFYKSFQATDIQPVISAVRALNIRGCSVSMPFKESVMPFLDGLDPLAERTGAVNTVVNNDGRLIGYNTDVVGILKALQPCTVSADERILVLGSGGVAKAAGTALVTMGFDKVTFCGRNPKTVSACARRFGFHFAPWEKCDSLEGEILINATSVGMSPDHDLLPIDPKGLDRFRLVLDVVATPPVSALIKKTRDRGIVGVDGFTVTLHQAAEQFFLYTGHKAPLDIMRQAALSLLAKTI
ncbi:MAG: shikimate dehydrogenase [Magnetococcales bacterium]|nr:shikimate dehydrogenase [Magnetococcales bacterium]